MNSNNPLRTNIESVHLSKQNWESRIQQASRPDSDDYRASTFQPPKIPSGLPILVVLGAEVADSLRQNRHIPPSTSIVVAEADPGRIRTWLEQTAVTDFADRHELFVAVGDDARTPGDTIDQFFQIAYFDNIGVVGPLPEREQEFEGASENLRQYKQRAKTNKATVEKFLTEWYINFSDNLSEYLNNPGVTSLDAALSGQECALVGPGATLDERVDDVKELSKSCLIALDTAVPILNRVDCTPDFVVTCDTGSYNREYLDGLPPETSIVGPPYIDPFHVNSARQVYFFDIMFPPVQFLRQTESSRGFLKLTNSVSTGAMDFVRRLSPERCYCIGLDFSYMNLLPHSRLSHSYDDEIRQLHGSTTLRDQILRRLWDRDLKRVEVDGKPVHTSEQFQKWADKLEAILNDCHFPVHRPQDDGVLSIDGCEDWKQPDVNRTIEKSSIDPVDGEPSPISSSTTARLSNLLEPLEEMLSKLKRVRSLRSQPARFPQKWLQVAKSLSAKESIVEFFQWEIERLSDELNALSQSPDQDTFNTLADKQSLRWERLLESYCTTLKSVLGQ